MMFRLIAAAVVSCAFALPTAAQDEVVLENEAWRITIEPATLAIEVQPAGHEVIEASTGVEAHTVGALEADAVQTAWTWDDGAYTLSFALDGNDLTASIGAAAPGELAFLQQAASGRGLILPYAEGRYVPADNATWQQYLTSTLAEINTTQDLSLPLWGVDHGAFTLTWLMTNPFNNTLSFSADGDGVAIGARHAFTRLDPAAPLTFILHLDGPDLIAGAKRYRQHLIDTGSFETLADKIAATPAAQKLIGATHVYLWGDGLLGRDDVTDWRRFLQLLRSEDPFAVRLREHMEDGADTMLGELGDQPQAWQRDAVLGATIGALNAMARAAWMANPEDAAGLVAAYTDLRQQFAAAFSDALSHDIARWGSGESVATIETVRGSGLTRLWIGLGEGWEAGLWHPEAIAAAVDAGYLIAPYDSYQDAMQPGLRTDWTTSHLGQAAHEDCAVIRADGTPRAGFQGEGHYTTPDCVRPLLEARIRAIQTAAGFNSWFLDSYAAGMLFDSYRPGAEMTQAAHAAGNARTLRFVNEALGLPTGSEDGNATTAGGVLFGHGMQTPFIGWGDPELHKDRESPYYVGGWWPGGEPAVFFKRVPLPERYRTIHFDPALRLPLYEAVFHDSIITSHHWSFDSLKFEGIESERELTRLLYNVPGLYHLSEGTLDTRLPIISRQDGFFRPLHELLWDDALTGFRWLADDRLVQETAFADGTRLVANFAAEARQAEGAELPARSITAFVPGAAPLVYQVE